MKIIHCADIHLDSKMETNLPVDKARDRNNEIIGTFCRMIEYAVENGVRVILICGDLFDTKRITGKTADSILSAMEQAKNVDFLYLRGNHEESRRAFAGRVLPPNLKLFSEEKWQYYQYGDICIAGIESSRENTFRMYRELALPEESTNIVMLHGQVSTQCGGGLICLPMLRDKNIRYLALGHLHSYQEGSLDLTQKYAYSGCLEGRGFDECGEKGFVLLNAENRKVSSRFLPFSSRQLYDVPVDISDLHTVSQILGAMTEAGRDIDPKHMVKFTLRGTYAPDTQKDIPFLISRLKSRFWYVKIKDESRLAISSGSYEHDISLKGEFIRMVMASDRPPEEKEKIITLGIRALSGEEIVL